MANLLAEERANFLELARPICRHEFGHHVAARLLGFKTGIVRVEISEGGRWHRASSLIVPTEPHASLQSVESYLCRRIVVLLSGVCAEALNDQSGRVAIKEAKSLLETTAGSDGEKALELCALLYGLQFAGSFTAGSIETAYGPAKLCDDLLGRAAALIEGRLEVVLKLTEELLAKVQPGEVASLDARVLDAHPLLVSLGRIEM